MQDCGITVRAGLLWSPDDDHKVGTLLVRVAPAEVGVVVLECERTGRVGQHRAKAVCLRAVIDRADAKAKPASPTWSSTTVAGA